MTSRRAGRSLRRTLDERFVLVVAVLVVLALVGGWAAYTAYTQSETADATTELDHRATVQEENTIYESGTELTNRETYFTSITPELDGELRSTYDVDGSDELLAETEITLHVRWVPWEDAQFEQRAFWNTTRQLEEETVTVESDGSSSVDFTVDVAREQDRIQSYREQHGEVPGHPELVVVAETDVVDPEDGNATVASDRETLSITLVDDVYTVEETDESGLAALLTPQLVRIGQLLGSIGLVLASVAALGGLAIARHRGTLAPDDDDAIRSEFERERRAFDDWISRGRIPDDRLAGRGVEVATLADLVDVAIDSDRRVLEDPDRESYYVLVDDTHYEYEPPSDRAEPRGRDGFEPDPNRSARTATDDEPEADRSRT